MTTLYQQLVAAGCTVDSHESDLYVEATDTARAIVKAAGKPMAQLFRSNVDGKLWLDVPFAYDPWWQAKLPETRKESQS